ncbi:MAG: hypothetical protein ACPL7K_06670, partial [Armatimonadota bacterium]
MTAGSRCRYPGALAIAALVALLAGVTASGAAGESLINPGFEEPFGSPPEWTATILSGSVPVATRDTESKLNGSYGGHIKITGASTGHAYLEQVVSGLTPGVLCTV